MADQILYCADAPGAVPDRVQVMRTGSWDFPDYGRVNITQADLQQVADNFSRNVRGQQIPVNIEHQRHLGAIGWYHDIAPGTDGKSLWASIQWTPTGEQMIREGRFRYFSPELSRNTVDPETKANHGAVLVGGALTNYPRMKQMAPILPMSEALADALASSFFPAGVSAADTRAGIAPVGSPMAFADDEVDSTLAPSAGVHVDGAIGVTDALGTDDGDGDDDHCTCATDCPCRDADGRCTDVDDEGRCLCECVEGDATPPDQEDDDDEEERGDPSIDETGEAEMAETAATRGGDQSARTGAPAVSDEQSFAEIYQRLNTLTEQHGSVVAMNEQLRTENYSLQAQIADATTRMAQLEQQSALLALAEKVDALERDGKIGPQDRDILSERLVAMADDDAAWLIAFLDRRQPVDMAELGSAGADNGEISMAEGAGGRSNVQLHEQTLAYAKAHNLDYRTALLQMSGRKPAPARARR